MRDLAGAASASQQTVSRLIHQQVTAAQHTLTGVLRGSKSLDQPPSLVALSFM